jgi:epoxyqueuosine reductase
MSQGALEHRLEARAYALGFDLVGFARLGPPDTLAGYDAWLAAGHHADLAYMERSRELRADATRPEPGMVSAIVVGMNYGGTQPSGPIARYARGQDYHRVLWDRLDALGDVLREESSTAARTRGVVDSAPFLERDLARRAGLGWFGKNTMLISPTLGSFFVLGALLTDLELVPSAPFEADRCGTCTRCLDACPTDAFVAPRVLDAGRCISYHTIENRSEIPPAIAERMGDLILGCDICQEVCPWNVKFARDAAEAAFAPRAELTAPDLEALLALDDTQWRTLTAGTALRRPKRAGFLRNVLIALANRGDRAAVPAVTRALDDPEPLVRAEAERCLVRLGVTPPA